MNSIKISKSFYQKLTAAGMAKLTSTERDDAYIKFLTKKLPLQGNILDCACGYGRLTIPLAKKKFKIQGIDLSACMIKAAKISAKKENLNINFKTGDMCKLPYKDKTFDAVMCMWSSFNHLLTEKDQRTAIKEMLRVIISGGIILIDLPKPISKAEAKLGREFIDEKHKLCKEMFFDIQNVVYIHDKKTMTQLLKNFKNCSFVLKKKSVGKGRERLIVEITKI